MRSRKGKDQIWVVWIGSPNPFWSSRTEICFVAIAPFRTEASSLSLSFIASPPIFIALVAWRSAIPPSFYIID